MTGYFYALIYKEMITMKTDEYAVYLRKSRTDMEAEKYGDGDTLSRHRKILLELARRKNLPITQIYEEVVSGETISARPQMQALLHDVEAGKFRGVLVMEVERLARGNTRDQGIVADSFKYGNTLIITPAKTYDPHNEFDEEYFEFGLFMSRREYKTINRRLQRGRMSSLSEGKYIAGAAPFGYRKVHVTNGKGYTLEVVPDEAATIRLIYDLYTHGEQQPDGSYKKLGLLLICKKLDAMHIRPAKNDLWSVATVRDILTNPTYTGKVRWQWRKCQKIVKDGSVTVSRRKDPDCMVLEGLHDAIIPDDVFARAREIMASHSHAPVADSSELKNALSGIVYCGMCGKLMTRTYSNTRAGYYTLKCPNRYCKNVSAPIYLVENKLLDGLQEWLNNYRLEWDGNGNFNTLASDAIQASIIRSQAELSALNGQLENTFDLLEKGIYTTEVFVKRNQLLTGKISELSANIDIMKKEYEEELLREKARYDFIPNIENILDLYGSLEQIRTKNDLIKTVIERVEYTKTTPNTKGKRDLANFELKIFPKIPRS